jgi:DUF1009 family protein
MHNKASGADIHSGHQMKSRKQAPLGLIAGNGAFPSSFIDGATAKGLSVVVAYHHGEADIATLRKASASISVRVGQLGKIARFFKDHGVMQVFFLGGIRRSSLWKHLRPDVLGIKVALKLASLRDDGVLRSVAGEFERHGFEVSNPIEFLTPHILDMRCLTNRTLTVEEHKAALLGWRAAKQLGAEDRGQTVVVRGNKVVARENFLGTDNCIQRSARQRSLGSGVVVKLPKPQQDRRLDLPAVGPKTIALMQQSGCSALVLETEGAILTHKDEIIRLADNYGITIMSFPSYDHLATSDFSEQSG